MRRMLIRQAASPGCPSARRRVRATRACLAATLALGAAGCHTDMWIQPKVHKPYQGSDFFTDQMSARAPVADTVARGTFTTDEAYIRGVVGGQRVPITISGGTPIDTSLFRGRYVKEFPIQVTRTVLKRGQERFNAFCAPCHGAVGDGDGMITRRGLLLRKRPPSYHTARLRRMPVGHFYDVITHGFGLMYSYASRIQDPADRWAIVAYIRALQLSQNADAAAVPADELQRIQSGEPAATGTGTHAQ